jgi:thiol:disulfide interchange protein
VQKTSKHIGVLAAGWLLLAASCFAAGEPTTRLQLDNFDVAARIQYDSIRPGAEALIELSFNLAPGWHAYADKETAAGGMALQITPKAEGIDFGSPLFPSPTDYTDPSSGQRLRVYMGRFPVYVPFKGHPGTDVTSIPVDITIKSAVCTDQLCTIKEGHIAVAAEFSPKAAMDKPLFVPSRPSGGSERSLLQIFPLAILAGLALNIMPCVWPVLPIIIMRLITHAREARGRAVLFGVAFSAGILIFFLAFVVVNIVLRVGFGAAFSFADISQNADYLVFMSLLLMVLSMFMFGVFSIGLPSSLAGKVGGGAGVLGTISTGFLAAILATPCSFGILVAVLVWAQSQPIPLATVAIMLVGVGMALPYLVLTAIPHLMRTLPRPGKWLDIFKQAVGYVLLVIAVKQVAGLPTPRLVMVLYYAPILAFAVWMWGSWVDYTTPTRRKVTIRAIAVVLAVVCGVYFLPAHATGGDIAWQPYDAAAIEEATQNERPVLIDFTAAWCLNCTAVDKLVYSRKDIADLIDRKDVLPIRADVTLSEYPASAALKALGEPDIPLSILMLPHETRRFRGVLIGSELKKAIEELPDRTQLEKGVPGP